MDEYDQVGSAYGQARSPDIGVAEVQQLIAAFDRKPSVLDIGCGNGFPIATSVIDDCANYLGIDSSRVLAEEFAKNVPSADVITKSMDEVDLANKQFDLVFGFGSFFHLPDEQQRRALPIAANAVVEHGLLMFTASREAGQCTGNVAGIDVPHWSLGEQGYRDCIEPCGLCYLGWSMAAGENCMFLFARGDAREAIPGLNIHSI